MGAIRRLVPLVSLAVGLLSGCSSLTSARLAPVVEPAAQSLRSSGTLLVADTSSTSSPPVGFAEYSLPNGSLLATVSDAPAGLSNPSAFAFDSKKNIYVLSSSSNGGEDPGDVLIFTRG